MPFAHTQTELVTSHPEWFGIRRPLDLPGLERFELQASDGTSLQLHHVKGDGPLGPVVMTPGTAMSALSFCVDTVAQNLVEYLSQRGFDVWLFDWRTSPELEAHATQYTMDDVARYDLPTGVAAVLERTGAEQVGVVAHCLSSTAFHTSLARGYLPREQISHLVASQVALHLVYNWVGRFKQWTYGDKLISKRSHLHFRPEETTCALGDTMIGMLSHIIPKSYVGGTRAMHRHSATFGDLLRMERVSAATVKLMGSLIPEVAMGFLRDVQSMTRRPRSFALTTDEVKDLDRLRVPITYLVGEHNNMFVPEATRRTYALLCEKNGEEYYDRTVIEGYGHLDCIVGEQANEDVFPHIADALSPGGLGRVRRPPANTSTAVKTSAS